MNLGKQKLVVDLKAVKLLTHENSFHGNFSVTDIVSSSISRCIHLLGVMNNLASK